MPIVLLVSKSKIRRFGIAAPTLENRLVSANSKNRRRHKRLSS